MENSGSRDLRSSWRGCWSILSRYLVRQGHRATPGHLDEATAVLAVNKIASHSLAKLYRSGQWAQSGQGAEFIRDAASFRTRGIR